MFMLEVEFVWGAPWAATKILYFFTRYSQFPLFAIFFYQRMLIYYSATSDLLMLLKRTLQFIAGWLQTSGNVYHR
jgi:hypothetical protein